MEAKSQEFAYYRFHLGLYRRHKIGFFHNLGASNYLVALWHFTAMNMEGMMTAYHRARIKQTSWYEKAKGKRLRTLS